MEKEGEALLSVRSIPAAAAKEGEGGSQTASSLTPDPSPRGRGEKRIDAERGNEARERVRCADHSRPDQYASRLTPQFMLRLEYPPVELVYGKTG